MLRGRADTKVVRISSRSALPSAVVHRIAEEDVSGDRGRRGRGGGGAREPGKEFYTSRPPRARSRPGDVAHLSVTFHAREPGECLRAFNVAISDDAGLEQPVLGHSRDHPMELKAEAYDIKVHVEWPDNQRTRRASHYEGLDFGSFKVVDEQTFPKER